MGNGIVGAKQRAVSMSSVKAAANEGNLQLQCSFCITITADDGNNFIWL